LTVGEIVTSILAHRVQVAPSGCHLFTGCLSQDGYGLVGVNGRTQRAHRVVYEQAVGPIPEGHVIDHLCRVRNCVNPAHMEPVTPIENTRRGFVGFINNPSARKTHCKNGHEFSPENTRIETSKGKSQRRCLVCRRQRSEQPIGGTP
jgi:hypothetical protein